MLSNYLPILIFLVIATGLAMLLLVLGSGLGRSVRARARTTPRNCRPMSAASKPSKTAA